MDYPKYIKIGDCVIIHSPTTKRPGNYYRIAGEWELAISRVGKKWIVSWAGFPERCLDNILNVEAFESTEKEWRESNRGYVKEYKESEDE
jgi:hypothetical protein